MRSNGLPFGDTSTNLTEMFITTGLLENIFRDSPDQLSEC